MILEFLYTNRSWISIIASIVTVIGVLLAVIEFYKRSYDAKKQVLIALKSQLEVIGIWSGYERGGYHLWERDDLITNNAQSWSNPFHQVYFTEDTALQSIFSLPGISYLSSEVTGKIAPLNQELTNFQCFLESINNFRFSEGAVFAVKVSDKINRQSKEKFTPDEDRFREKLVDLYTGLHFELIGDEFNHRLYYKHKELYELVCAELEKRK